MVSRFIGVVLFTSGIIISITAAPVALSGTVTSGGTGIEGVTVRLTSTPELLTETDGSGAFTLTGTVTATTGPYNPSTRNRRFFAINGSRFTFMLSSKATTGSVVLFTGNGRKTADIPFDNLTAGSHSLLLPHLNSGLYFISISIDATATLLKLLVTDDTRYLSSIGKANTPAAGFQSAGYASTAPVDTLRVEKDGYLPKSVPISNYQEDNIAITIEKEGNSTVTCNDFTVPASFNATNAKMPDPFSFLDGTRMTHKEEWLCRRNEIRALAEATIYGTKPPKPDKVEATYSNGELTIASTVGSRTKSFSVTIADVPSGSGPHPAIINFGSGGMSMGPPIPDGVATISYPQDNVASEKNPRPAKGVFNDLYPELSNNQGALIGWAWGLSRIVDALEIPAIREQTGIDPTRLGTMGCSRWGKGAGMAVFDDRITLPIVLSPGSGFASIWRIAQTQNNVQTASQIYGECTWMGAVFQKFGGNNVNKLPLDQHEIIAMRAPRPIVLLEGTNDSWNCPVCCYHAAKYASFVFEALGVGDRFGWGHGNHGHCAQSGNNDQMKILNAFVNRFLLNKETSTEGMFNDSFTFDKAKWQDGEVPTLTGTPPELNTLLWKE